MFYSLTQTAHCHIIIFSSLFLGNNFKFLCFLLDLITVRIIVVLETHQSNLQSPLYSVCALLRFSQNNLTSSFILRQPCEKNVRFREKMSFYQFWCTYSILCKFIMFQNCKHIFITKTIGWYSFDSIMSLKYLWVNVKGFYLLLCSIQM